jgi:hypothetical protein
VFQPRLITAVGQEAIDVLGNQVAVVALAEAIKVGDYSGKLLVNG